MDKILAVRSNIYNQFHGSNAGYQHFFKNEHGKEYAAYYTAMYLIQDTGESVQLHMEQGFSSNPWSAYIEFWGVMQAIFIQQDAIIELYEAVIGLRPNIPSASDWSKLRDVRNLSVGHPAKRTHGVPATQRTFMGRNFGNYDQIEYELWDARMPQQTSHPTFNLRKMIKAYDVEGAEILDMVLSALAAKWPRNVTSSAVGAPPTASVAIGEGPGVTIVITPVAPGSELPKPVKVLDTTQCGESANAIKSEVA